MKNRARNAIAGPMAGLATTAVVVALGILLLASPALGASSPVPAGPPYPQPVAGQRVYDYAGIFSADEIASAEATIAAIEQRTRAQVAVYTQVKPQSDSLDKANSDAAALMDQWGVGRKGFDDGLVIVFDMQDNLRHGQVSLFAGSGFRAAFLTNAERQDIFGNYMLPMLKAGAFDVALANALRQIDAAATPEHAATLEHDRQINALVALGGLLGGLLLALLAFLAWLRHGRDPVYLDDSSILMPAPPPELTPAMATLLMDDRTSDRTLTAGLVDLAARGCIAFHVEPHTSDEVETGIAYLAESKDKLPGPEDALMDQIKAKGQAHDSYVKPERLYHLLEAFSDFKDKIEETAVARGWLTSKTSNVTFTWQLVGALEIVAAIAAVVVWLVVAASAVLLIVLGLTFAGIVSIVLARYMPARTRQGAMLYAMLAAYSRTMKLSMANAQSMGEVVKARALPWVTTPDQAMAWGIALGLNTEVQAVLARSATPAWEEDTDQERAWRPAWWLYSTSHSSSHHGAPSGVSAGTAGLYSATLLPDPGSIMAALHSIGNVSSPASSGSRSSSSSSFGSSFGGGGSSGGGGAGGGF
jgi:uncharacterized protein (TIGR04222 family)